MTIATRYRPYGYLAEYYDRILNPGLASIQEATHKAILGAILEQAQSACDLACGTGSTAIRLAKSGIRTFAVDNSPACADAHGKRPAAQEWRSGS
jgi:methylase of polypeptide subunit release factors